MQRISRRCDQLFMNNMTCGNNELLSMAKFSDHASFSLVHSHNAKRIQRMRMDDKSSVSKRVR